jgi:hypothetical protein
MTLEKDVYRTDRSVRVIQKELLTPMICGAAIQAILVDLK